jgi:hypothetical protein
MNDTTLTWNVTNWISVILMVSIGFGILGLAQKIYQKSQGN